MDTQRPFRVIYRPVAVEKELRLTGIHGGMRDVIQRNTYLDTRGFQIPDIRAFIALMVCGSKHKNSQPSG